MYAGSVTYTLTLTARHRHTHVMSTHVLKHPGVLRISRESKRKKREKIEWLHRCGARARALTRDSPARGGPLFSSLTPPPPPGHNPRDSRWWGAQTQGGHLDPRETRRPTTRAWERVWEREKIIIYTHYTRCIYMIHVRCKTACRPGGHVWALGCVPFAMGRPVHYSDPLFNLRLSSSFIPSPPSHIHFPQSNTSCIPIVLWLTRGTRSTTWRLHLTLYPRNRSPPTTIPPPPSYPHPSSFLEFHPATYWVAISFPLPPLALLLIIIIIN